MCSCMYMCQYDVTCCTGPDEMQVQSLKLRNNLFTGPLPDSWKHMTQAGSARRGSDTLEQQRTTATMCCASMCCDAQRISTKCL